MNILLWTGVDIYFTFFTQKFLFYVLKSSDVLDILVPILYHLNDARSDQCKNKPISVFTCRQQCTCWTYGPKGNSLVCLNPES